MALYELWLFSFLISVSTAGHMQGGLMTFMPIRKNPDGSIMVDFRYKETFNGSCNHEHSWNCQSGDCGEVVDAGVVDVARDTNLGQWCQSEGYILRNLSNDKPFELRAADCCWISNVLGTSNWQLLTHVDMGNRSDSSLLNRSPVTTMLSAIRVPQNCMTTVRLLAHDPDGDHVHCRFGQEASGECASCSQNPAFHLSENLCTLHIINTTSIGAHVFELVIEDFPKQMISLTYEDGTSSVRLPFSQNTDNNTAALSKLPLQFAIEILPPLPTCDPGILIPQFLPPTPSHGDMFHVTAGQEFQFHVKAQATQGMIYDFQISGPPNLTKHVYNNTSGILQARISWTPEQRELYHRVPICYAAETTESQSEMRCIIVAVERFHSRSGEADVVCTENTMTISLNKSSIRGLHESHLRLNDPSCTLTSNESHVLATVSLNSCGTQLEETATDLTFKNEIVSVDDIRDVITRKHLIAIPFTCTYSKKGQITSNFKSHKSAYVFTEAGFGSFGYVFEFYTSSNFSEMIDPSTYPLEVELQEMLYMSIQAHSSLANTELFVESCRASPYDDPNDSIYYDIMKDGCIKDNTVVVYSHDGIEFRFGMEAFRFIGDFDQVYISCTVILCDAGNADSRCAQGCIQNSARRRRSLSSETERHYISQGPLCAAKGALGKRASNVVMNTSTRVFAGAFAVAVLLLCGVLIYNVKRSRTVKQETLLSF